MIVNLRVGYIVRVSNTIHASLRQFPSIKNMMLNMQVENRIVQNIKGALIRRILRLFPGRVAC